MKLSVFSGGMIDLDFDFKSHTLCNIKLCAGFYTTILEFAEYVNYCLTPSPIKK